MQQIKNSTNEILIAKYIDLKHPFRVLDLGCGNFLRNSEIIEDSLKYDAIDKFDILKSIRCDLTRDIKDKELDPEQAELLMDTILPKDDLYEYYKFYVKEIRKKEPITKEKFDKKFRFVCSEIGIRSKKSSQKYDLIIISKCLSHILKSDPIQPEDIIKNSKFLLNPGGKIFLRLNGEGYPESDIRTILEGSSSIFQIFDFKRVTKISEFLNVSGDIFKIPVSKNLFNGIDTWFEYILIHENENKI